MRTQRGFLNVHADPDDPSPDSRASDVREVVHFCHFLPSLVGVVTSQHKIECFISSKSLKSQYVVAFSCLL